MHIADESHRPTATKACIAACEEHFEREKINVDDLERDDLADVCRTLVTAYADRCAARRGTPSELPPLADADRLVETLADHFHAFGALGPAMRDPEIMEIQISSPDRIIAYYLDGRVAELPIVFRSDEEVQRRVRRMLRMDATATHHLDERHVFVDGLLSGGERLHVVGPPVGRHHKVNIRKAVGMREPSVGQLISNGTLGRNPDTAGRAGRFLQAAWLAENSIIVTGSQGSGKTTSLRCLLASAAQVDASSSFATGPVGSLEFTHTVVLEEAREIDPHEELTANIDCFSCRTSDDPLLEVTMARLVKEAKRTYAQRIVVGEIRDGQVALDALSAAREGLPFAATLHAETAAEAIDKFGLLMMLGGAPIEVAHRGIAGAIDFVVVCERARVWNVETQAWERRPRITEIAALTGEVSANGDATLRPIFTRDARTDALEAVGNVALADRQLRRFDRYDIDTHGLLLDPVTIDARTGSVDIPSTVVMAPATAVGQ